MDASNGPTLSCPVPQDAGDRIRLAHGEGARLSRQLVRDVIARELDNEYLRPLEDGAVLPTVDGRIVLTTDSSVVSPLFFPGGDIGRLAVHGTINDLAASGAEPIALTLGLIIEEGLPVETLRAVIASVREASRNCGVPVVTGDTKVVPRGAADQLFLNTTGLGRLLPGVSLGADRVRAGDRILISGTIADHGVAILAAREGLEFGEELKSDSTPLHGLAASLLREHGQDIRFLRDPTRGGVSAALQELTSASGWSLILEESTLPLNGSVRGACELLGLDPLYVANEGKLLAVVSGEVAERALATLRHHPLGRSAAVIGEITADTPPQVIVRGPLGPLRILDEPSGAPLPRIC